MANNESTGAGEPSRATEMAGLGAVDASVLQGEPYEIGGRRIRFTNWYFVRPGWFDWCDREGTALPNITWNVSLGPEEATFRQTDEPRGIRLVAQPAERSGPLLELERPWEEKGTSFTTVIHDDGGYRAWGPCEASDGTRRTAYYESADGLRWARPDLGLVEYGGSKANNLLEIGPGTGGDSFFGWTVFKDPSAPPAERYKAIKDGRIGPERFAAYRRRWPDDWQVRGYRSGQWKTQDGLVSPDGIRWEALPDPVLVEHADGQATAYYDRRLAKYVMYARVQMVGPRSPRAEGEWGIRDWVIVGRRSIGRTESTDFRHFPPATLVLSPGPDMAPSDALYTNCRTAVPGAPEQHLMFPAVYSMDTDAMTVLLASSYDGRDWHLVPGPAALPTAAFGEWDGGCVLAHPDLLELPDGCFALPYTGYVLPHKYPRGDWRFRPGYALWPHGRLSAIEASEEGRFATVGFLPPTQRLRLNVRTQRAGFVRVEAVSLTDRQVLPGRSFADSVPLVGDKPAGRAAWKGGETLGVEAGKAVYLRFHLKNAQLFGLDFD